PTTAMRNSDMGDSGSRSMFETPPNRNSVMLRTGMPNARAVSECAISWARTDANSSTVASAPIPHRSESPQSGWAVPNTAARFHVIRAKMSSQLQSMFMLMPNSLPMRKPLFMAYSFGCQRLKMAHAAGGRRLRASPVSCQILGSRLRAFVPHPVLHDEGDFRVDTKFRDLVILNDSLKLLDVDRLDPLHRLRCLHQRLPGGILPALR